MRCDSVSHSALAEFFKLRIYSRDHEDTTDILAAHHHPAGRKQILTWRQAQKPVTCGFSFRYNLGRWPLPDEVTRRGNVSLARSFN